MEQIKETKYGASYYAEIQRIEGEQIAERIFADATDRYQKLISENNQLPPKIKEHTDKLIFPAIAVYQALLEIDSTNALRIMKTAESKVSMKTGAFYQKLVKPKFMRKIFLKIFSKGVKSGFSEESGFSNQCILDETENIAFLIKKCPYHDYCVKMNCPELAQIFCHNDINAYGNLPGIAFERHETLGEGGSCCDFHLYLKK